MLVNIAGERGCFSRGINTLLAHFHTKVENGQQVIETCCEEDYRDLIEEYRQESTERC